MERTLLLVPSGSFYYFNSMRLPDVVVFPVFRKVHGVSETVWKAMRKLRLVASSLFYTDWYKDLQSSSKIIVSDFTVWPDPALLRSVSRHKNLDAKCYLYSRNIVRDKQAVLGHSTVCRKRGFLYYSYDESDCKQCGLYFNTIMHDENLRLSERAPTSDILFLGFLKDRKAKMLALYQIIPGTGMKSESVIVKNGNQHKDLPFTIRHSYANYADHLDMVSQSKAILDITQQGQNGFPVRVMESIFLDRRLVLTNMVLLPVNFYDPNNILVINLQNPDEEEFIVFSRSEFHPYSQEARRYYSAGSWINRFQQ